MCVSWPHACICPAFSETNSSPVSSGTGRPSMSARRRIVGPGSAALDDGNDGADARTERRLESEGAHLARKHRLRLGKREADLGDPVEAAPDLDKVGEDRPCSGEEAGEVERRVDVGHAGSMRRAMGRPEPPHGMTVAVRPARSMRGSRGRPRPRGACRPAPRGACPASTGERARPAGQGPGPGRSRP